MSKSSKSFESESSECGRVLGTPDGRSSCDSSRLSVHPSIQAAIGYAQARIPHSSKDVETILADECPDCLTVPEFAFLVGVDCDSYRLGAAIEADVQDTKRAAFEAEQAYMRGDGVCRLYGLHERADRSPTVCDSSRLSVEPTNFGRMTTTGPDGRVLSDLTTSHSERNLPSQRALDPFQRNGAPCWSVGFSETCSEQRLVIRAHCSPDGCDGDRAMVDLLERSPGASLQASYLASWPRMTLADTAAVLAGIRGGL